MYDLKDIHVSQSHGSPDKHLVVLHGWGSSSREWLFIKELFPDFNVVLIDLPGFGQSPAPDTPWDIYEYTSQISGLLWHLGIKYYDIIAHSFGGRIATILAARESEQVNRIVLVSPAGVEKKSFWVRTKILGYKFAVKPWNKLVPRIFQISVGSSNYRQASPIMRQILSLVTGQNLEEILHLITHRTLVIWGQNDSVLPVVYADVYQREVPNVRVVIIDNADHFPHKSTTAAFSEVVGYFFRRP